MTFDPESLFGYLAADGKRGLPPVHLWNPECVQDIDLRIGRDGTWYYQGSSIDRKPMVELFSTVLRRDDDGFFLVTPIEKIRVCVDLAPFIAIRMESIVDGNGPSVAFQTNVGDVVVVDRDHPVRVDEGKRGPLPFVRIRDGLDALMTRSVFYELANTGIPRNINGVEMLGFFSRGEYFVLGPLEE